LNEAVPLAKAHAEATGHPLRAADYSEIARLAREWRGGNADALEGLRVWTGAPAAKPTAPAIGEDTDLGRLLLETAGHRSPFFAETGPRTVKDITEDAGIPGATPGIADEIGRMPVINGDQKFHELTQSWARMVPFGGQRLDG